MPNLRYMLASLVLLAPVTAQRWWSENGVPHRVEHAVCYHAATGQLLLFGGNPVGSGPSGYFAAANHADFWVRSANGWQELAPSITPGPRVRHSMVYDSVRQRTVLFGGMTDVATNDTWEFDGTHWSQRITAHAPGPRLNQQMAFDASRGRVVLFGGSADGYPLVDTWEFDGQDWTAAAPISTPSPNLIGTMAYSQSLGRCILVGTAYNASPVVETWSYDGITWNEIATANAPAAYNNLTAQTDPTGMVLLLEYDYTTQSTNTWRFDGVSWSPIATAHSPQWTTGTRLAFDSNRQRVIYTEGDEMWEFDGTDWLLVDPGRLLPRRLGTAMAFDTHRDRLVTFGGWRENSVGQAFTNEQWEWNGTTWSLVPQATAPSPRYESWMVYDSRRQRLVLFGGYDNNAQGGSLHDTWEHDGTQWHQVVTTTVPSQTVQAMCYDPVRARCIAFAADTGPVVPIVSTWEYDGADWTYVPTLRSPSVRRNPELVFDAAANVVRLYGGYGTLAFADTWQFHDGEWWQDNPQIRPPVAGMRMTFDVGRGRAVLNTGIGYGNATPAYYEYDGSLWHPLAASSEPARQWPYPMIYDAIRKRLLTIGPWSEVWSYTAAPAATWTRLGVGCTNGIAPELDRAAMTLPSLGSTFVMELRGLPTQPTAVYMAYGFGFANFQGAALPQTLGTLGLPDCSLWVDLARFGDLILTNGTTATHALTIPAAPSLAGLHFAVQGFGLDPTGLLGLGWVTNAGLGTIY